MENIFVVAAHPDDEVIGAGGTIARHAASGKKIHALFLGDGVSARYPSPEDAPKHELSKRKERAREAADVLGIEQLAFAGFADNRFDSIDLLELVKWIEAYAEDHEPETVYTHHASDLNVDHRKTHQAVLTAFRPTPDTSVQAIYGFEVLSSTEWKFGHSHEQFSPDVFIDVEEYMEQKEDALKKYDSEIESFPHPRSVKALRSLARYRGATIGYHAAEAFESVRICHPSDSD